MDTIKHRSGLSRFFPASAFLSAAMLLSACSLSQVRTREEAYPDGARKSRTAFIRLSGDAEVRHGVRMTWYPSGERESMETYVHGYLQGYAIRWYPGERMQSVEHYTDGVPDGQAKAWDPSGNLVACFTREEGDCLGSDPANASPSRFVSRP